MCARTGWSWEYVWELGVDRIEHLEEHWRQEPPVDLLVANFLGYKPKKADEAQTVQAHERGEAPALPPPPKSRLTEENVGFLDGIFNRGRTQA